MVNKADLIAAIRAAYTLNPDITDWDEVEDALIFNDDSVVNSLYGGSVSDDEATETYTTSNANFDYKVTFNKVGGLVVMSITLKANVTLSETSNIILTITDSSLLQASGDIAYASAVKLNNSSTLPIVLNGNTLITSSTIFSDESFKATLIYKSEN